METLGLLSHIQTYCTKDGPGIRTTAFFIGCNLRCLWCANPEAMYQGEKLFHHENICTQCGKCVKAFPQHVQVNESKFTITNREDLIDELVDVCDYQAYERKGRYYTVSQLVKELKKDKVFFDQSNGGVTLSGGDPFCQPSFLYETTKALKEENIHVAIETAGLFDFEKYKNIIDNCDLFLYDIKAFDDDIHKKCTGVSNELIILNLKKLNELKKSIHARLVIVPNHNDCIIDIKKRIKLISTLPSVEQIDILKYHNFGEGKYKCLDLKYPLSNLQYDETKLDETIKEVVRYAKELGIKVTVGG